MFRFVHTSDLHLGKPFGVYSEKDRLGVARRQTVSSLIAVARRHNAADVLVAGDVFDTPNPAPATWRQAIAEMSEAEDVTWWLLPGNHDNLREGAETWSAISALDHKNIHVLSDPQAVEVAASVEVLPAPLLTRHATGDPTQWMTSSLSAENVIRIGLAHGPIKGFGEGEHEANIIAPDRDKTANLDYLALGDWHGKMRISDRVWYSGSPERDRFKHNGPGQCLVVTIAKAGAVPEVEAVDIGAFDWQLVTLDVVPGTDAMAEIQAKLPDGPRRNMLVKVLVTGRARLSDTSALSCLADQLSADYCHFEVNSDELSLEVDSADLDAIATGGALRQAGDDLAAEAEADYRSNHDKNVAAAALRRLHSIVVEEKT